MSDLTTFLATSQQQVNDELDRLLPPAEEQPGILHEAMRYSIFSGGKRIRPALCMATASLFGGNEKTALTVGAAIEMLHTYTLIHDDLPAMDDDALRRGRPTSHIVYGEANAILAGDALLTMAFEILGRIEAPKPYHACQLITELATASGSRGVIGGQVEDMRSESGDATASPELLDYIHTQKTARLLQASCRMGAILSAAFSNELDAVSAYGLHIGLAFQIIDDILDVTSNEKTLGKPIGSDAKNNKLTYVSLYGLDAARKRAQYLYEQAVAALTSVESDTSLLEALAEFMLSRLH
ncbi:MAG: polyprenyl synthetase family protein [Spartobacteria bacterium]|nr:polyprenyl synthetase family protein [Spartobacteria bacterium]